MPASVVVAFLAGAFLTLALVRLMFWWHDRAERLRRVAVARRRFVRPVLWPNLPWSSR